LAAEPLTAGLGGGDAGLHALADTRPFRARLSSGQSTLHADSMAIVRSRRLEGGETSTELRQRP
jgi:hypothetical protein